jgi:hypothetical protein
VTPDDVLRAAAAAPHPAHVAHAARPDSSGSVVVVVEIDVTALPPEHSTSAAIVRACCDGVRAQPGILGGRGRPTAAGSDRVSAVHVGVSTAGGKVSVIRDADGLSLAGLHRRLSDLDDDDDNEDAGEPTMMFTDASRHGALIELRPATGAAALEIAAGAVVERVAVIRPTDTGEATIAIRSMIQLAITHPVEADVAAVSGFLSTARNRLGEG